MIIESTEYDEETNAIWLDGEELSLEEAKMLVSKLETAIAEYEKFNHESFGDHENV